MGLAGVRVGPLDPDRSSEFGQVSGTNSARTLIRLHTQAHPPALMAALSLKLDSERTKALDLGEVDHYLADEKFDNGDPVIPDGAEIVGAAVRGERDRAQVLTFTYRLESGRTAKWFADYTADVLPESYEAGTERVHVAELRERGIVQYPHQAGEGANKVAAKEDKETRRLRERAERAEAEVERLREAAEAGPSQDPDLAAATGSKEPLEGGEAADGDADEDGAAKQPAAGEDPPFDGYDELKADEVIKRLKADETSDEDRQAILDYEKTHANRKGVVGAGETALGARGNA